MTTSLGTETANTPMPGVGTISAEDYGSRQRGGKLWLRLGLASFIVLVLAVLAWGSWALTQSAKALADVDTFAAVPRSFNVVLKEKGELKAARSTDINCEVEGRSTIITLIPEGTAVKQGDLLVELASDEIDNSIRQEELKEANAITAYESAQTELEIQRDKNASDVRKAELEIELKRLELEKYQKGDWEQMLKDHTIAIDQAELNLKRRKEDFSAAQELRAKDFITKTEYEEDEFNKLKAEWDLDKAKKALEVLKAYTHVAALRKRQSDLDEAVKECARVKKNADAEELKKVRDVEGKKKELDLTQDELADLRAQKEKTRITAPTQGFVVYFSGGGRRFWSSDDQIKVGATVHERQTLLSLPDTSEMLVVLRVHEAKTDKLRLGQPAKITVEGLPGHEFTGKVTKIAVVADTQNRWLNPDLKEYETEVTMDPTDLPLKPGVTAHVEILVETVDDSLAVPIQSVYAKGGRRYVFRADGSDVVPAEVHLGAIGTEWAEVTDGLAPRDQVLLAFSDDQKRLIPDLPTEDADTLGSWRNGTPQGPGVTRDGGATNALQPKRPSPSGAPQGRDYRRAGQSGRRPEGRRPDARQPRAGRHASDGERQNRPHGTPQRGAKPTRDRQQPARTETTGKERPTVPKPAETSSSDKP